MDLKNDIRHDEHAKVSPSSLKRTVACPGSLKINAEAGSHETKSTKEGTKAHMVAECFAREALGLPPDVDFKGIQGKTKEMIEYGQDYANFALRIKHLMEGTSAYPIECDCERRVSCEEYIPECWGTSDLLLIGSDKISIIDYKYGVNQVEVAENDQLKAYALGVYLSVPEDRRFTIKTVDTYIFQPRARYMRDGKEEKGYYGWETYDIETIKAWALRIKPIVEKALAGVDERMGGKHCMFCAAKDSCQLSVHYKTDFNNINDFDEAGSIVFNPDGTVSGGEITAANSMVLNPDGGVTMPSPVAPPVREEPRNPLDIPLYTLG